LGQSSVQLIGKLHWGLLYYTNSTNRGADLVNTLTPPVAILLRLTYDHHLPILSECICGEKDPLPLLNAALELNIPRIRRLANNNWELTFGTSRES